MEAAINEKVICKINYCLIIGMALIGILLIVVGSINSIY